MQMEPFIDIAFDRLDFNITLTDAQQEELRVICIVRDIVYCTSASFLLAMGIPGNLMTIVVMQKPAMRDGVFSTYIISLCFCNLLLLVWVMPRFIVAVFYERDVYFESTLFCGFYRVMSMALLAISNWHLVVLTSVRLLFVVDRTHKFHCIYESPLILLFCVMTLVLAAEIPASISIISYENKHGVKVECHISPRSKLIMPQILVQVFIPAFLLMTLNMGLCYFEMRPNSGLKSNLTSTRLRKQLVLMVTLSSLHFIVCFTPFVVMLLNLHKYFDFDHPIGKAQARLTHGCGLLLLYSNNGTNFLLYAFFGRRFRRTLFKTLQSWCVVCPVRLQRLLGGSILVTTRSRAEPSSRRVNASNPREKDLTNEIKYSYSTSRTTRLNSETQV